jgi:hypothetical protein
MDIQETIENVENNKLITIEFGAMSSKYSIQATNKLTAYVGILMYMSNSPHLIALYSPKEIVENDSWLSIDGKIADRLDEIFGGKDSFDNYSMNPNNKDSIIKAIKGVKKIL